MRAAWGYAAVALGSGLGALARYGLGLAVAGPVFPWATLSANVAGSVLIGAWFALTGPGGVRAITDLQRQFVVAGFCGGFTTFSIFSLETLELAADGATGAAAANVALSAALWMAGVLLGVRAGGAIAGYARKRSRRSG